MKAKRIIAMVLILALALPFTAFAEDAEPNIRITSPEDGSVIGKSYSLQYPDGYAAIMLRGSSSVDEVLINVTCPDGKTINEYIRGRLLIETIDLTTIYRSIEHDADAEAPAGEYVITATITSTGDSASVSFTYEPDDESEKLPDEEKLRIAEEKAKVAEDAEGLGEQAAIAAKAEANKVIAAKAEANKTEKEKNGEELTLEEKADVLVGLGVLEEEFKSKIGSDTVLSRGETAAAVLKIMGIDPMSAEEAVFTDVPLDGQWADVVYTAYSLNVINGQGDGTFAPEEEAVFGQTVKMLVNALGYDPAAKVNGGYPAGYMIQGARIGLTKGIAYKAEEPINADNFAELLYNALDIPMMEMTEYSPAEGATYGVNESVTLRGFCGK